MKFSRKDFLKKTLMGVGLIAVNANANVTNTYYPKANILNFGAKANGKSDDSYAIIKALKELGECYIPKHPNGFILGDIIIEATNIHGPGTVVKSPKAKSIFIMSGVKSSIEGLTFNSKDKYINTVTEIRLASSAMNIKIQDCNFESSIYSAIAADTNGVDDQSLTYKEVAKDIMISNCIFSGRYSRPIYLHSVENISIIDNIIKNSLFDGIRLRQRTGKCLIANNQFSNIGTKKSSDSQDAIDSFWSGSELTITNNMIDNCMAVNIYSDNRDHICQFSLTDCKNSSSCDVILDKYENGCSSKCNDIDGFAIGGQPNQKTIKLKNRLQTNYNSYLKQNDEKLTNCSDTECVIFKNTTIKYMNNNKYDNNELGQIKSDDPRGRGNRKVCFQPFKGFSITPEGYISACVLD